MRDRFAALGIRDFRRLFLSQTVSVLGSSAAPIALAFAVLEVPGATPTDLGIVLCGRSVAQIIVVLLAGVLADRLPRLRLMIGSDLLAGAAQLCTAALVLTSTRNVGLLVATSAVNGAAAAMFLPAANGLLAEIVAPEHRQSANGLLRTATNAAGIAGAMIAAAIVAALGPGWALVLDAFSFLVSAGVLFGIESRRVIRQGGFRILGDLRDGWDYFISSRWIWVVVVQFAILNACTMSGFNVLGPVVADRTLGGATAWSAILAARSVGFLVGSLVAIRIRPRRPLLVAVLLTFGFAPTFFLLAAGGPVPAIAFAAFLKGLCGSVFSVLWATTLQSRVPSDSLSRISSYDALGSYVLGPIGLAVAGPIADAAGLRETLVVCGVLSLCATMGALIVREVRDPDFGARPRSPSISTSG